MEKIYSFFRTINLQSLFIAALFSVFATAALAQPGNTCGSAISLPVNINQCVNQQVSNAGLTASGQLPVGAGCSGYNGGDLWVSVVMPASGEVTVTTSLIPGTTPITMDINLAVYSGSCGSLTLVGCDADGGGSGFFAGITFSGTPGNTFYVQLWETNNNVQGTFNICANGTPQCVSPVATFSPSCLNPDQYEVDVNITSLGSASSLSITNDAGAPAINGITSTGIQTVGPIALGTDVNITIVHSDDASCNVSSFQTATGLGCVNEIVCGSTLNQNYCYGNNDASAFLYTSDDGSPLVITFNSGLIEAGQDEITIRDGDNPTAPILFSGDNGGDLSGLTETAASGSIYMTVNSDAGASCQDASLGLGGGWNWDVECGLVVDNCGNATSIVSRTTFAASEIPGTVNGFAYSGTPQCNGPGNNPDPYFSFTAVGSVQYFRVETSGDFNPAVEVFDACGGNSLACVNEAGPGQRELFWVTGLTVGQQYVYRVYHAGTGTPSTTAFETAVAHIPTITLFSTSCGATGLETSSYIRANTPQPAFLLDGYVFEFTELEAPFNTYEVNSPNGTNPNFRMSWLPQVEYGRSYSVRVRARMYQGPNLGEYGAPCTITMAGQPITQMLSIYDGGTFVMCNSVKCTNLVGTTNYRWTFDDGLEILEYNSNGPSVFCPLKNVSGLQYGASYVVNVYATINGVESTVSVPRILNMAAGVPNTRVNPSLISCGSTVPLSQVIQAVEVCAASQYTFRFTNLSQPQLPVIEYNRPTRVALLAYVSGLVPGDTYSVAVRATSGGAVGEYAEECELTIFNPISGIAGNDSYSSALTEENTVAPEAMVSVYPNPSTGGEVRISATNLADQEGDVRVEIYDLQGKRLFEEQFGNSGNYFNRILNLNGELPTGVYLVRTILNGEQLSSEKLIIE